MAAFIPPTPVTGVVGRAPSAAVSTWRPRQLRAPRRLPPPAPRQWRAAAGAPTPAAATPTADARPLSPGDTIAVVGATGGVGLLTLRRLAALPGAPYALRAVSRSTPADGLLPRGVTAVRGDIRRPAGSSSSGGSGGSGSGGNVDSLAACLADAAVVIISVGTTAFPTLAWRGGNTPRAVDEQGVAAVVAALGPTTTRVVFVSSIGVERRGRFPFFILNAFGVLDAKAAGEAHVAAWVAASPAARSAAVVRPGRLTGAPQTNVGTTWVGGRPAEEEAGVVARGDTLLGDVSRSVTADAVAWAVTAGGGGVLDFSVVGRQVEKGRGGDWTADLDGLLIE
ncbi:hypothetical protein BU14_0218s0005 [Porphyra umbilicalis]|uniref:NAD(P)-binding domain-containing protein n=1 Tax=Porphyra umbilicalis TaxID=2786 RepID=A0A1X6P4M2_PORUM|nr:hypothetical protein BU14_0218s0005 [Porphyra umbilicalis]|eukprot:OSX75839.1 hypothetical protein BU14_0218s0005 [Porphyra umbilicalis]